MQITIISVDVTTTPTQKGSYQTAEVTYKNNSFQDKVENKKVMSFNHKEVFATLSKAEKGDVFTLERAKNDKGFWDWTSITEGAAGNAQQGNVKAVSAAASPSPKSTYETPEERAKKQVYIVRQSSLSTAVEYMNGTGAIKKATAADVIFCAQEFEKYVFGSTEPVAAEAQPLPELDEDDIPY